MSRSLSSLITRIKYLKDNASIYLLANYMRALLTYRTLIIIYLLGGSLAVLFSLALGFNKELMGVVFLGGGLGAEILRRQHGTVEGEYVTSRAASIFFQTLPFLAIMVGLLSLSYYGQIYFIPTEFFLCSAIAGFAIIYQILFLPIERPLNTCIILTQILLLTTSVSLAFLFVVPGSYGNDSSYHIGFIESIISTGHLNNYVAQYENHAGFHILFTDISMIMDLGWRDTAIIMSAMQGLFGVVVFVACRQLFGTRAALGSALFFSIMPHLIFSRYAFFPSTYSLIFVILFLCVLFHPNIIGLKHKTLLIIIAIAILITHPLTPIILIVFVGIYFTMIWSANTRSIHIPWKLIGAGAALLIIWLMIPISNQPSILIQIQDAIKYAIRTFNPLSIQSVTLAPRSSHLDVFLYDLGLTMALLFAVIGAFTILRSNAKNGAQCSTALAKSVLLFLPLPFIIAMISSQGFPDRWLNFAEVIAAMVGGVGLVAMRPWSSKTPLRRLFVSIFTMVMIFMAITTPAVNPNAQIYSTDMAERQGLTYSEAMAGQFVNSHGFSRICGNSMYLHFIDRDFQRKDNYIIPWIEDSYSASPFIVRNYDMEKGFTIPYFGMGKLLDIYPPTPALEDFMYQTNKIYDNNEVGIYNAR